MNWALLLFVGFSGFSLLMYRYHAKDVYEGPVAYVQEDKREQ